MLSKSPKNVVDSVSQTHEFFDGRIIEPDQTTDLVARKEVDKVCSRDDVPVSPDDILVVFSAWEEEMLGCASVYGCGEYRAYRDEDGHEVWEVEEQPDGYVIHLSPSRHDPYDDPEDRLRNTVRHELAHICGWETELCTYEDNYNHSMWLDLLGAE